MFERWEKEITNARAYDDTRRESVYERYYVSRTSTSTLTDCVCHEPQERRGRERDHTATGDERRGRAGVGSMRAYTWKSLCHGQDAARRISDQLPSA